MQMMDMSGGGGVPWLDSPVMLHSSREDTCKLTPEQCTYRNYIWRYWYEADHQFALSTVYFVIIVIGLFAIGNIISKFHSPSLQRNSLWQRAQAWLRFVGYRGFRVQVFGWYSPPLAYLLVALAGAVFFFGMTLGPQPYYWPNTKTLSYGSSPPIATRTGWMAVALLPFVIVLAAKANWVTAVTGVPHEKLQVFHRYTSYAMFVLALIHTFPFIVYHIWYGDMTSKWNSDVTYWTGVAAIIPQAYLTFMSCAPIRNRFYEFFKSTHYFVALVFVIFFFLHCDFRLSSWDYFIATGTLYLSSLLFSHLRTFLAYGTAHVAHLSLLPCGNLVQIAIPIHPHTVARSAIPIDVTWQPGQHVFLRFLGLGLHSVSAHPFTICSLPPPQTPHDDKPHAAPTPELRFVVKPAGGLTGKLHELAKQGGGKGVRVTLDGPYGGVRARLDRFDRVLVVAGGSGAGFTLPLVESVLRANSAAAMPYSSSGGGGVVEKEVEVEGQGGGKRATQLRIVVATRDPLTRDWYSGEVAALLRRYGVAASSAAGGDGGAAGLVDVAVHVTGSASSTAVSSPTSTQHDGGAVEGKGVRETQAAAGVSDEGVAWRAGRPDLPTVVEECARAEGGRMAVAVCGPAGMLFDVRNAAARVQREVVAQGGAGAREVWLHSEHFSW